MKRSSEYKDVVVFYKVPFALPPVDTLRFRAPVMATDWSIFDHSKVYHEFDQFIRDELKNHELMVTVILLTSGCWRLKFGDLNLVTYILMT